MSPLPLRVRPESSIGITELSEHESDGGEAQKNEGAEVEIFPILGQPAATVQPCDRALDDPPYGQQHKALGVVRTFDDFNLNMREDFRQRVGELRALISGVGDELFQERKHPEQCRHDENAAIAVLNIG